MTPALHVHHVSVRFGDAEVLQDVGFDVPAGSFLAIVGPNGAGKSTLMKVALGLITPQRGHAAIFGAAPASQPERVGYVPQLKTFDRTFPATALELVVTGLRRSWPARVRPAEAEAASAALQRVGAAELAQRPLARLSGGELQRAYLARALVREPELVLLDEPATGMDLTGTGKIRRKHAFKSHILTKKSTKRKRNLTKMGFVHPSDEPRVRDLLRI